MISPEVKAQAVQAISEMLAQGGMSQEDADQIARDAVDQAAAKQGR